MSFAFLGRIEGRLCLYSQLTGVVPGYQSQGLGYQIKIAPARFRPGRGDRPDRLGVRPAPGGQRPFQPGPAGRDGRPLHRQHVRRADRRAQRGRPDRPPDRRVGRRQGVRTPGSVPTRRRSCPDSSTRPRGRGGIRPRRDAAAARHRLRLRCSQILLEIPADIARLRREQPELAEQWRLAVRPAFQIRLRRRLPRGLVRPRRDGTPRRVFYVLER